MATLLVATCREDRSNDTNERAIRQLSVAVERIAGADPILLSMGSGDQYVLIDVIGGMYVELDRANGLDAWTFLLSDTRVLAIPFGDVAISQDTHEDLDRLSELRAAGPRLALYLTGP